ncbi:MAG: glycerophosphodiester phosphodiesterase [Deltaproteobacteria bacterium]|nr:glycerophosphodiester phosphodiesterase [Deltaproteobacteria bacterium]MBW2583208.1 glycerophosphodiester phosphodiesterase [Deltaproteobacteria bacterium]
MFPKFIKALLGLFLIFFVIYGILYALARPIPDHPYFKPDKFLAIAHRGGRSLGPENTLYTFKRAVELGTNVLEMDLQTTSDGALVILHDRKVDRTTNGTGAVDGFTLSDLKKLDAGFRWSPENSRSYPMRNKGVTIPTLTEVFKDFHDTRINIEIKSSQVNTIQNLCRSIRDNRMSQKVMVACFDAGKLGEFRSICPEVATSAGASEAAIFYWLQWANLESAYSPNAQALQVPETYGDHRIATRRFVDAAHARNMRVHVWTVNQVEAMQRLIDLGVDGIMTDYPERLVKILKGKQKD